MRIEKPDHIHIPALRALWQEAFGDTDAFLDDFFSTTYDPGRCRCVLVQGQVAAALYWFDCSLAGQKLAYIYAVATAKRFRGRGLCHKLMDSVHTLLSEEGYAGSILVPGEESLFRLYRGMGYCVETQVREFTCRAAGEAIALTRINAEAYAQRRKALLPPGGIVQEGENLAFLQTQAAFYAGEAFLLAAAVRGDTLQALELLGDPGTAAGILTALGCTRGHFRTPGNGRPHALCCPLRQGTLPTYLAFDFA